MTLLASKKWMMKRLHSYFYLCESRNQYKHRRCKQVPPRETYCVPDNAYMLRRAHSITRLVLGLSFWIAGGREAWSSSVAVALRSAVTGTQASAIVLDEQTGAVLGSTGEAHNSTPGSAIKPLLLAYALRHGIVQPDTSAYCQRKLKVGELRLFCTHPADEVVFTARTALAESCNTWFAAMARRFSGPQLEAALQATHLPHATMQNASVEKRQLAVLGLRDVSVTPLLLAQAYRQLLRSIASSDPVAQGLRDSVRYGMADQAAVRGLNILGKTGTASNPGEAWTHGWFAGALAGRFVLVIYVPRGDGGTAALLAKKFFTAVSADGNAP
jgi:membrane peptidoglycan carboxypeptidase